MAVRRTMSIRLRQDAPSDRIDAFERALAEAPNHMPSVLHGRLGKNIISRRAPGWNYTWDTLLAGPEAVAGHTEDPYYRQVLAPFFSPGGPGAVVDGTDGVAYEPRDVVVKDPDIRDCYKRSLIIQVREGTPPDQVDAFDRALGRMPEFIPSIVNWALSRASGPADASWGRYTLVWEQEFRDLDGYRAYGAHPYHWGPLDDWFDSERPSHIATRTLQVYYPTASTVLGWKR